MDLKIWQDKIGTWHADLGGKIVSDNNPERLLEKLKVLIWDQMIA